LDKSGRQVVFSIQDSSGSDRFMGTQIWYYKDGMNLATAKVSNTASGVPYGFQIQGPASFIENSNYIQFSMKASPTQTSQIPKPNGVQLEVWSYKDMYLRSAKTDILNKTNIFKAVINTQNQQVIPLETEEKKLYELRGNFAIVKKLGNEIHGERFWEEGYKWDSCWLISLGDGSQYLLPTKCDGINDFLWFSPTGKYIVYFDASRKGQYFSYDLHSKEEICISAHVPAEELGYVDPYLKYSNEMPYGYGLAAWLENDKGLLVYGKYDIWLLDLKGKKHSINLTNGYGRSNDVVFSYKSERFFGEPPVLKEKEDILLKSFNSGSKYNGFYHKILGQTGDPEILCSGAYFFNRVSGFHDPNSSNDGMEPVKAKDVNVWIVQRQSVSDAPNYYLTKDFKSFSRLTNFQPHARFRWLSQELHSFQHLDGEYGQGILFKPENFDSSKKYPVIIIFYRAFSNNLHQFPVPEYNHEAISAGHSPIWLLNNGYLVFAPDIYVAPLKYGPAAFDVIEGAARYLKQLPFVDGSKLGCGSHSWSAKLGAYLFTHSDSFSAMAISEGFLYANMLNPSFSIGDGYLGYTQLEATELDFQFGNLWENRDTWLDQTTIVNVDKARSPLLLLCNNKSSQEYQNQTLQLYTALRRLEKKAWWLKYAKGGHTLDNLDEMKDLTIRYTQYFDHYLKEAPAPKWMTVGNDAQINSAADGYELDPAGSCAISTKSECSVCRKWNEKYKKDSMMFKKRPISEWKLDNLER
jgi:dienelactone hydrolase